MGKLSSGMKVNTPVRRDGSHDGLGEIVGHGWKPSTNDTDIYYHVALLERKATTAGRPVRIYTESQLAIAE